MTKQFKDEVRKRTAGITSKVIFHRDGVLKLIGPKSSAPNHESFRILCDNAMGGLTHNLRFFMSYTWMDKEHLALYDVKK